MTSFANFEAWGLLLQFFIIAVAIVLAYLLRMKIPLLRRSLIPTALIAGIIILLSKLLPFFNNIVDKNVMELITYHALGIGFVALALKNKQSRSQSSALKVMETGALTASSYVIQGIVGLFCTIPLFIWWNKTDFFYSSGLLLPMGYGQGPGQALNMGNVMAQNAANQGIGFAGSDFGLAIAAIGFLVGSIIGVIYMNIWHHRGVIRIKDRGDEFSEGFQDVDPEQEPDPNPKSASSLGAQFCLIMLVYGLVFLFMWGIEQLPLGNFGTNTLKPLIWGFNFLWGTLFGVLIKGLLNYLRHTNFIRRDYADNNTLNRLGTTCFDVMIVAGTAAINFENLSSIWLPLIIVCTVGAIATFQWVLRACRHLYPEYPYEAFFSMFGMLTGTASNGMILLREIDPKFETPAANNLVLQVLPAIVFGFPVLILIGFAPISMTNTWITLAVLILYFTIVSIWLFRKKIFKIRSKKN